MIRATLALLALVPATALRVTVLGGNGYVGQRVCEKLVARGCDVTSISKSGKAPSGGAWTQSVKWVANDLTRGSRQELEAAVASWTTLQTFVDALDEVVYAAARERFWQDARRTGCASA